jgi:superfamily II DNA or RNA helicase
VIFFCSNNELTKMSIHIPLDELSTSQKIKIRDQLKIELPHQFDHIYEKRGKIICLPFSYGNTNFRNPVTVNINTDSPPNFKGELRQHQNLLVEKTVPLLATTGSAILSAYTGAGKTITAIYIACMLRQKTLVITNKLVLIDQWQQAIKQFVPDASVQYITNPKKYIKNDNATFFLINPLNIPKIPLDVFNDMETVIIDELHQVITPKLCKNLFCVTPTFLIGLSATPYRPDPYNKAIGFFFGDKIVGTKLQKKHKVYTLKTKFIPNSVSTPQGLNWNEVLQSQALDEKRNKLIVNAISLFPDRVWLILVKRIVHAELLVEQFTKAGLECETLLRDKVTYNRDAKILIGTTSKIGVGFDHAAIDALLIATDIKEYFIQFLGRCMRRPEVEPIVIDIVDNFRPLIKNYKEREKVYKAHGGIIKQIDIPYE